MNLYPLDASSSNNLLEGSPLGPANKPYHAPGLKIHGKLERLTLQGGGGSLGGGGTGDPTVTPTPDPLGNGD
ncbi:hypothetical protein IAD21_05205 [Abditibacteriota bacterium]|nr:hypothetical protein IAD21_05205 [Abditibacteriota bacterium]